MFKILLTQSLFQIKWFSQSWGEQEQTGENPKVVWAKVSTLS
jgi:hypothetical protein